MSTTIDHPPRSHIYSVDDYYRMREAGVLQPGDRVELIKGEIIDMAPIGSRHAGAVNRIGNTLKQAAGERAIVAMQNPVRLDNYSEPQPDIALLRPCADFYAAKHPAPADVMLLVEVADNTLRYDRETKVPLYAWHGIPEVWLVDMGYARITVYSDPGPQGYNHTQTATSLTRIPLPGLADTSVDLSRLFGI